MIPLTEFKRCAECGDKKSLDEFHFNAQANDQRHSYCKICRSEQPHCSHQKALYSKMREGNTNIEYCACGVLFFKRLVRNYTCGERVTAYEKCRRCRNVARFNIVVNMAKRNEGQNEN